MTDQIEIDAEETSQLGKAFKNDMNELSGVKAIERIITEGKRQIETIFGYKTAIGKLIQVRGDADNKKELYKQNLAILGPNIQIMRDLFQFNDVMRQHVVSFVNGFCKNNTTPNAEESKALIDVLDVVIILDYLKTWQAGLNNDFAMYRRAIQHVKKDYNMSEDETLRHFLVNPHNINKALKTAFTEDADGFEKVLSYLASECNNRHEKEEKNEKYVRVAVCCIFLIDQLISDANKFNNMKKNMKFHKINKLFETNPKVSLHHELPLNVPNYLKSCPNFTKNADCDKGVCTIL
ncbi:hypothetical protein FDP41_013190 [Naegleria fowleri]|uniref:CYRIA/CYRIB Rac1 binding domain-containing protein n=1 Tax=Naegleria fowleri TaxID=5763 RepID=A0A6A5BU22_NAEFO|nr:uncharacterized protein FDP41_013190 [Naegleria fowleri]KAF0980707.1 hypothetical protein FDP41_013190 [Naegleria fowleri]CAG4711121.1 unnamed protein product [Naegleria fowleri]